MVYTCHWKWKPSESTSVYKATNRWENEKKQKGRPFAAYGHNISHKCYYNVFACKIYAVTLFTRRCFIRSDDCIKIKGLKCYNYSHPRWRFSRRCLTRLLLSYSGKISSSWHTQRNTHIFVFIPSPCATTLRLAIVMYMYYVYVYSLPSALLLSVSLSLSLNHFHTRFLPPYLRC